MDPLNIALAAIGALVLAVGVFSQFLKRTLLQEPIVAVALGIAIGPYGCGWLDLAHLDNEHVFVEQAARITLAIAIMGTALRLSRDDLRTLWRPAGVLLTAGMIGMWVSASLLAMAVLDLPLWTGFLIGAVITPTDPIVASSIVTGKFAREHLPARVRHTLSLESGTNDGLAYLFVMLPVFVLQAEPTQIWWHWFTHAFVIGIVLGMAIGAAFGYAAAWALHWANARSLIENYSFMSYTVALSLFTLGAAALVGADALISVFVAGMTFTWFSATREKHEEENFQEAVGKLFTLPMFVIFGVAVPWAGIVGLGLPLLGFVILMLLLRRVPIVAALAPWLRSRLAVRDIAFLGWFGPLGIAAIYYAALALRETGETVVWEVASAAALASILVHGVTAAPFSRLHHRAERHARGSPDPA